ncbi:MAG: stage II sporulation protein P [Dethiobacter sp.]|nr:stage II sporulation protein P [Dethiobacter sp.]
MAGKAFFYFHRKRTRWDRKRGRSRIGYAFWAVILVVVLLVLASRTLAIPVLSGEGGIGAFWPDQEAFYRHVLGLVIPGVGSPASSGEKPQEAGGYEEEVAKVAGPLHPRSIFAAQIPYLDEVAKRPQPLIHQVNNLAREQQPTIVVPQQLRQGLGKVIIYHTHTTESFVPTAGKKFTEDLALTVARLGEQLATLLREEYAIPVVHNQDVHDIPRSTSYEVALTTVRGLLEEHQDTVLLIDLHRDGVDRQISTLRVEGQAVGRILFVVGSRHPQWQENFSRALFLHERLEEIAPGLSRGVRERPLVYNQHLHPGALLIEVGGHENSLQEAMRAVPYLAQALAKLYYENAR